VLIRLSTQLPKLLEIAKAPETHWRYSLTATRFLRALIRRDQVSASSVPLFSFADPLHLQPMRPDVASYMAHQLISDLPNQRTHSMLAYVSSVYAPSR
jgi:proteasome activator subunit 4